jgi:hypothetical protein
MKSARERAEEAANAAGIRLRDSTRRAFVSRTETAFKEHARDQRHLCADAVSAYAATWEGDYGEAVIAASGEAMCAPAPGES